MLIYSFIGKRKVCLKYIFGNLNDQNVNIMIAFFVLGVNFDNDERWLIHIFLHDMAGP